jgi:hypothetical protein
VALRDDILFNMGTALKRKNYEKALCNKAIARPGDITTAEFNELHAAYAARVDVRGASVVRGVERAAGVISRSSELPVRVPHDRRGGGRGRGTKQVREDHDQVEGEAVIGGSPDALGSGAEPMEGDED